MAMANDWKVKFIDNDSSNYQIAPFPTKQKAIDWIKTQLNQNKYDPTGFEVVEGPYNDSLQKQQMQNKEDAISNQNEQKINLWFDSRKQAPDRFK